GEGDGRCEPPRQVQLREVVHGVGLAHHGQPHGRDLFGLTLSDLEELPLMPGACSLSLDLVQLAPGRLLPASVADLAAGGVVLGEVLRGQRRLNVTGVLLLQLRHHAGLLERGTRGGRVELLPLLPHLRGVDVLGGRCGDDGAGEAVRQVRSGQPLVGRGRAQCCAVGAVVVAVGGRVDALLGAHDQAIPSVRASSEVSSVASVVVQSLLVGASAAVRAAELPTRRWRVIRSAAAYTATRAATTGSAIGWTSSAPAPPTTAVKAISGPAW